MYLSMFKQLCCVIIGKECTFTCCCIVVLPVSVFPDNVIVIVFLVNVVVD